MKIKILLLFILIGSLSWSQKPESEKLKLVLNKNIKYKVEAKIKSSKNSKNRGELLLYETPLMVDFFVNDSLTMSSKGEETELFRSFYYTKNDTISIDGAFGLFGGYGFSIKLIDQEPLVYTLMAADQIPIYALNKTDSLQLRIEVPCKNVQLILSEYPKLKANNTVYGYLEFESAEFYEGRPSNGRKENQRTKTENEYEGLFQIKFF